MLIDLRQCIGCQACTVSCHIENAAPLGSFRTTVSQYAVEHQETGEVATFMLPRLCNHCENPPCVPVCPVEATFQRQDGIVVVDSDRCVGCAYCVNACPYDARFINERTQTADKCTFCTHRLEAGLLPACVESCVGGARIIGDMRDPVSQISRLIAQARAAGTLEYVVVDPGLNASASHAADHNRWVPIRPGSDSALAMGMIQWLLDHEGYAKAFLALPGQPAAEAANEATHTNATHLVIDTEGHPRRGRFLRASDLGQAEAGSDADLPMVVADDGLVASDAVMAAELFVDREVELAGSSERPGENVRVKSSMTLLREAANEHSLATYAEHCGIPEATIVDLASRFARHGRRAVTNSHGGMMSGNRACRSG